MVARAYWASSREQVSGFPPLVTAPHARFAEALADRYSMVREIGARFLARDIKHDRDVALKVLRTELAAAMGSDRCQRGDGGTPPGNSRHAPLGSRSALPRSARSSAVRPAPTT